jgi:Trp operon repressor
MKKKISINKINELDKQAVDKLIKAADLAASKSELEVFLKGLLTKSEQLMFGRRLLIAELLLSGMTQAEIIYKYKISPNTVWRINKWLIAEFPEYGQILKQTTSTKDKYKREGKEYINNYPSFSYLKKRYPGHFLLFHLLDHLLE